MESNISFLIVICLLGISFYYYSKSREYEKRHYIDDKKFFVLNKHIEKLAYENANYKVRIRDLQKYKNDVSKTFKILDTELVHINNHVEKNSQLSRNIQDSNNHISLLTPDMLSNLLDNMNQDFINVTTTTIGNIHINNNDPIMNHVTMSENQNHTDVENNHHQNQAPVQDDRNDINNQPPNRVNNILRSLSFPNLPSTYQRLMLPIIQSNSDPLSSMPNSSEQQNKVLFNEEIDNEITAVDEKNNQLVENE